MVETSTSFVNKEISLSKGIVQYKVGGKGRSVLYLHSAGGPRNNPALEQLSQSFKIYAPVFPGFDGTQTLQNVESMKDLAHLTSEFIQTVIGEKCDVIGHSFGGWVACWLAVLYPDLTDQLVLETPAGFRPEGKGGLVGDPETLMRLMYAYPERLIHYQKPADIQIRNREMVDFYHAHISMDTDLVSHLENIKVLTLILAGTKDGVIPQESGHLLKNKIPNSYLWYIYDAAHNIEIDQPKLFTRIVEEFLLRGEAFIINWRNEEAI